METRATPLADPQVGSDPLIRALVRYVEALHRRYPEGPAQLRREALDRRANMPRMATSPTDSAA